MMFLIAKKESNAWRQ